MLSPRARAFSVDNLLWKGPTATGLIACNNTFVDGDNFSISKHGIEEYDEVLQTVYDESGKHCIAISLCDADLWESFNRLGTEMIITKSGRVRLPSVKPDCKYRVSLDFQSVDQHKYRYVYHSSKWMVSGTGDCPLSDRKYVYQDSPVGGQYLADHVISFEKLKLTNNDHPKVGQMSLMSMQKFIPRVHVDILSADLKLQSRFVTSFPQTSFMAVTAYQNQEITRLKIARNPFAKGFRDSGKNRSSLEAVMSSLHNFVVMNNVEGYTRKRNLSKEGTDLPATIIKPTLAKRFCLSSSSTSWQSSCIQDHGCQCHLCGGLTVDCRLAAFRPCPRPISRDANCPDKDPAVYEYCPCSFIPHGYDRTYSSAVLYEDHSISRPAMTSRDIDVKPEVRFKVKEEFESD